MRVRVPGFGEQRALVGELHDLAEVHHRHSGRDVLHHREVVRDEQVREPEASLQVLQQVDDLRLDRDIERRYRLVADDEPRLHRDRARDADALALPAGEFVRVAPRVLRRKADQTQEFRHPLAFPALGQTMQCKGFGEHVADGHSRVERAVRVLENHLHLTAQRAHLALREAEQVAPVEPDLPRSRLDQAQREASGGRLAAARFADQRQSFPGVELEADVVDRANRLEVLDQVFCAQQRRHSGALQHAAKWCLRTSTSLGTS